MKNITLTFFALLISLASFGTIGAINGTSTLCIGSSTTLTDTTTGGSWFSGSTAVATVGITSGTVTGVSAGTALISYLKGTALATFTITVNPTPTIYGPSTVCAGSTITLSDAVTGGSWIGGSTAVATVSSGVVTGVGAGVTNIYYVAGGCYAYHTVTVTGGAISGPSTVCAGSTITLSDPATGGTWLSSSTATATVSSGGVVTGVGAGTATIYYIAGGCYAYHTVTVTGGAISGPTSVCVGSTITLSDPATGGTWLSSSTAIATVSSGGVVTGVSAGSASIYYIVGGCYAYTRITVGSSTIYGPSTVCAGSTITLSDATTGGTWSVGSSSVATVSSGGVVTGVGAGVTNIYYAAGGCYSYHTVTVTGGAISGSTSVCAGSTITLSDPATGGTWLSSSTAIATVSSGGVVTGISAGSASIYYIVGGCYAYTRITVTGGATIYGPSTVCAGSTITLSDATSGGTWITSGTSTATVSSGGVVTGVSAGVVNIYYTVGGCYAYHTVTVTGGAAISGPSVVCSGSTITLSDATSGGTWISSNTTIATVSSGGVVTGVGAGVLNIYYAVGSCYAFHTVSVTGGATIYGPSTVCGGSTITLSDATSGGTWISSNTTIATITSGGVVSGVSAGVVNIYYTVGGCAAYHTVTVTGGAISGPSVVCVGSTITLSDPATGGSWISGNTTVATVSSGGVVTGAGSGVVNIYYIVGSCYAYHTVSVTGGATIYGPSTVCAGSTITLSDATSGGTWISGNSSVATVSSGGVVTGVSAGLVNIYYTVGGCAAYHTVTVTGGVISGPSTVCVGSTITLSDAITGGTWLTSSTSTATVSGGVVTGVSAGTATIYYIAGGCYSYKVITVSGGGSISGPSTVCAGSSITLSDAVTGGTWLSSSTSTTTVSSAGVVTGVSAGTATIYYIAGGCYAYHTVTVTGGASIYGPSAVCVGSTIKLSDATTGGTWISANTTLATVSSGGVVTGVGAGVLNIYYSVGGCYAYHTVTVTSAAISGPSTVCMGSTITLSDVTGGGSWISSSTAIATVSSGGVVTGVSAGTATIYYSVGGCYGYHVVTVSGGATIYGPSTVCVGSTITLSDATSGGTWITSSSATATISSGGIVTGVSAGVLNIYYAVDGCYGYHTVTVVATGTIYGPSEVCEGSSITLSDAVSGGSWISSNTSVATVGITSGVVSGVSAGTATIYYTGGCAGYRTVTVDPAPAAITGPSTVYVGSTITLSDATGGGTWISGNSAVATVSGGVVTGVSPGLLNIYYVIGTCGVYHTVSVEIAPPGGISGMVEAGAGKGTSGAIPVVGLQVRLQDAANNLIANTITDLTGTYAFSGLPNGSYVVAPVASGYATTPSGVITISSSAETVTGINFRENNITMTIVPVSTTGVNAVAGANSINIFPNPTNGTLYIKWSNQDAGNADIVLTDVVGREVYRSVLQIDAASGQSQIGLSELKNGMYLISVKSDNISYNAKLMIQK